jgi:hypothetical protein
LTEDEFPNHDHAEVQLEEEVLENKDLPQANIPHSPAPDSRTRSSWIKRKLAILIFDFNLTR